MTYPPHIFADNPINRGETERRDEDWILQQAEDPASRFLPFRNLNVLLTDQTPPELGWLSPVHIAIIAAGSRMDLSRPPRRGGALLGGPVEVRQYG